MKTYFGALQYLSLAGLSAVVIQASSSCERNGTGSYYVFASTEVGCAALE